MICDQNAAGTTITGSRGTSNLVETTSFSMPLVKNRLFSTNQIHLVLVSDFFAISIFKIGDFCLFFFLNMKFKFQNKNLLEKEIKLKIIQF
jgi:hypothetical protein